MLIACRSGDCRLVDANKAAGFAGANITYLFKQNILALLDAVDREAA